MFNKLREKLGLRKVELRILIPKDLDREDYIGGTKDFHKSKNPIKRGELGPTSNGKKVRYWKQVYKGETRDKDLFVPIYWKVAEKKVRKDQDLFSFK